MEQQNIVQFISTCLSETCTQPIGFSKYETHVYLVFCIFNIGRLFTYIPTIAKLRAAGCTGDGQSVWTWICWILANSSLSYYAYIAGKYQITDFVWINVINTFMCVVCLFYIIKVQKRAGTLNWIPFSKPTKSHAVTVRFPNELRQSIADVADKTGMPINELVGLALKEYLATRDRKDIAVVKPDQVFHFPANQQKFNTIVGEY
jgi:hypothetical protein